MPCTRTYIHTHTTHAHTHTQHGTTCRHGHVLPGQVPICCGQHGGWGLLALLHLACHSMAVAYPSQWGMPLTPTPCWIGLTGSWAFKRPGMMVVRPQLNCLFPGCALSICPLICRSWAMKCESSTTTRWVALSAHHQPCFDLACIKRQESGRQSAQLKLAKALSYLAFEACFEAAPYEHVCRMSCNLQAAACLLVGVGPSRRASDSHIFATTAHNPAAPPNPFCTAELHGPQ